MHLLSLVERRANALTALSLLLDGTFDNDHRVVMAALHILPGTTETDYEMVGATLLAYRERATR